MLSGIFIIESRKAIRISPFFTVYYTPKTVIEYKYSMSRHIIQSSRKDGRQQNWHIFRNFEKTVVSSKFLRWQFNPFLDYLEKIAYRTPHSLMGRIKLISIWRDHTLCPTLIIRHSRRLAWWVILRLIGTLLNSPLWVQGSKLPLSDS